MRCKRNVTGNVVPKTLISNNILWWRRKLEKPWNETSEPNAQVRKKRLYCKKTFILFYCQKKKENQQTSRFPDCVKICARWVSNLSWSFCCIARSSVLSTVWSLPYRFSRLRRATQTFSFSCSSLRQNNNTRHQRLGTTSYRIKTKLKKAHLNLQR